MANSSSGFQWLTPRKSANIQGYEIRDGLVYIGETSQDGSDFSSDFGIIDPVLEALPGDPRHVVPELRRWQRYARIPPKSRGAYLKWLADGRSDPEADIGYVYLFFHGLERRLLVDGPKEGKSVPAGERAEIVREVLRLLEIYGERYALARFAGNLIFLEWVMYRRDKPVPDCIELDSKRRTIQFDVVLADHAARNKPIPPVLALQWMEFHLDHWLKAARGRCANLIEELFLLRYRQKYGRGLVVAPENRPFLVESYAAYHAFAGCQQLPVPGLRKMARPFDFKKRIDAIADSCAKDMKPYNGFIRHHKDQQNSLAALILLPEELMARSQVIQKIKNRLGQLCANGAGIVSVDRLYRLLGERLPQRIGDKEAKNLAVLVEGVGFGLAPDIRFHNMKPNPDGKAAIFADGHGMNFSASSEYRIVGATLVLGAMISQLDGGPSRSSEEILRSQVSANDLFTRTQRDSLLALLKWCLATPQTSSGVRKRLAGVDQDGMAAIRHALVRVAIADGRILPSRIRHLEKLYPILGMAKRQVASDLCALEVGVEPVKVGRWDSSSSFLVPAPPAKFSDKKHHVENELLQSMSRPKRTGSQGDPFSGGKRDMQEAAAMQAGRGNGFSLNQELIRRRTEETHQARRLLEEIFNRRDEEAAAGSIAATIPPSGNPLNSLDKAHQALFCRLIQQKAWKSRAIQRLCDELGLMKDGAMEKLNEWFFDHANTLLIEDGDPVWINVECAKEIMNVKQQ